MKRSIFLKTFGGYVLIILVLVGSILLSAFGYVRSRTVEILAASQERLARALGPTVTADMARGDLSDLESYFRAFEKQTRDRLTLIDAEGVVLADSEEDPARMENHRFRPEVVAALEGRVGRALRHSDTLGAEMLYVALPLTEGGKVTGCLRVSTFVRDIDHTLAGVKRKMAQTAGAIGFLALILAFFVARGYTRPIGRMIAVSRKVAGGDFKDRIYLRRRDELGQLASSLNAMSERLGNLVSELTSQKEEIQGILSAMEEGLAVVEPDDRIGLANPSFERIFPGTPPVGKPYWEAVRNTKFNALIQRAREERKSALDQVPVQDRVYLVHASYIAPLDHVVATLHDITELASLEEVKRDLVANVSHELQTPLTAIKGYAETLEAEADDKSRDYLKIILRNTDRLIAIVRDLLLLSELEDLQAGAIGPRAGAGGPPFEPVDLGTVLGNVIRIFEPRAREKGLALRLETADALPRVMGDPFKLEQMVINLVDNALKYTEKGGVTVRLKPGAGSVVLEVEDTGPGIPEAHQSRIFERFYVVDKSRSRSLGGTGLGLSIVKHIVLMHRGTIAVDSREGVGTTFRVTLPAA
jgi:two-component system phosphate regulon sensor histidine kinase PhoR